MTVNSGGTTLINTLGGKALAGFESIAGTGNLILDNNSGLALGVSVAAVNNSGTIANTGTGSGTATVTGIIGTNVTSVTENSATSG